MKLASQMKALTWKAKGEQRYAIFNASILTFWVVRYFFEMTCQELNAGQEVTIPCLPVCIQPVYSQPLIRFKVSTDFNDPSVIRNEIGLNDIRTINRD